MAIKDLAQELNGLFASTEGKDSIMKNDGYKHGNLGNKNAVVVNPKTAVLTIRCTPSNKRDWVAAADGKPLPVWVTDTLNAAAVN